MTKAIRVLVVDDDRYDNDRYCQLLNSVGYEVTGITEAAEVLRVIEQQQFDVVLLDMLLPLRLFGKMDFGGLELLRRIKAIDSATQVIAVTGYGSRELAADAMRDGALDYITKDLDTEDRLPGSVRIAAVRAQALRLTVSSQSSVEEEDEPTLPSNLIADSTAMRQVLRRAQRLASIDGSLLITGELGVGKELVASIIHLNSRYAQGPFVVAACRSLSANLVELWGDAAQPGSGYCSQANGGTLLLKGIHELPFNQQKQLVPFLRERRYRAMGATADSTCDLRVIATTTADLERLVRQGRFWRALYDELNVATLDVPPLRERRDKDDILALAGYLLHRYGLAEGIAPAAASLLVAYDYPQGNIKELESILRSASAESGGGVIQPEHLSAQLRPVAPQEPAEKADSTASEPDRPFELTVRFLAGEPATLIWESDTTGSTRSLMTLPFPADDLSLVLKALEAAQFRSSPNYGPSFNDTERERLSALALWAEMAVVPDIDHRVGDMLFKAITADAGARSALDTARRLATQERRPFTLILRFQPDATALASLPWELMWDERQPLLLSRNKLASCIRFLDIPHALPPLAPVKKQLRLLAVSPTKGVPDAWHAEEQKLLLEALQPLIDEGLLEIEHLRPVRTRDLTKRLINGAPVDVLHFYGHGKDVDGLIHLVLDDGLLNASQFAALVGEIPLVVLYACRSAEVGPSSIFTGIAPMLSAEGVSTVIAMQYSILVTAANCFHSFLYSSLARGESVQTAVAKGRQALYVEFPDSWYLPVLYIRSRENRPVMLVRK